MAIAMMRAMTDTPAPGGDDLAAAVASLLAEHAPGHVDRLDFLRAQFDAGLAWVGFPPGLGGRGLEPALQVTVTAALAAAGAPDNNPAGNFIGLGMAAPTLLRFGTQEQQERWLKPLWTGQEVWCQLFSEPGAGSDLASVATSARRDGGSWVINGQKIWTTQAHEARWGLLLARTDPAQPKYRGLSYFVCDMRAEGVEVRPLRQLTGEAEFNEVFLTDVRIPDDCRIGDVGEGWRVAQGTLMNERVAIGGAVAAREQGQIGTLADLWRAGACETAPGCYRELMDLWVHAESLRLASAWLQERLALGAPGPEGSALKLSFAALAQRASSLALDLRGPEGLGYDDWAMRRPDFSLSEVRHPAYWYLRTRANSIEGGTSEIMRNIIAERVLGLPREPKTDAGLPWKDLPR
jgi:alkylation response protein AidB-like acyl-CoA dehydrogenase